MAELIWAAVSVGTRITDLPSWCLDSHNYDYVSAFLLTDCHHLWRFPLAEGLEAVAPDYLIVDSGLRGLLVDEGYFPPGPGFEIYRLPRQEFEGFLAERGEKLLEFSDRWHGEFEIYGIWWE